MMYTIKISIPSFTYGLDIGHATRPWRRIKGPHIGYIVCRQDNILASLACSAASLVEGAKVDGT